MSVEPTIDFQKVAGLATSDVVSLVNGCVSTTVLFLNKFVNLCNDRFEQMGTKLTRVEASISFLEAKLESVPDEVYEQSRRAAEVTAPSVAPTAVNAPNPDDTPAPVAAPAAAPPPPPPPPPAGDGEGGDGPAAADGAVAQEGEEGETAPAAAADEGVMTIGKDPRFAKWVQLLNLGVPMGHVQLKLELEGWDRDLLLDLDAPAPPPREEDQ